MSSPRNIGGSVHEGMEDPTVVLPENTASLRNSPSMQLPRHKTGSENTMPKTMRNEVGSIPCCAPKRSTPISKFRSVRAKSINVLSPDFIRNCPNNASDISDFNSSISGMGDLISACAAIRLNNDEDQSFSTQDLSHDQTFASAIDNSASDKSVFDLDNMAFDTSQEISENGTQIIERTAETQNHSESVLNHKQEIQDLPITSTICGSESSSVVPCVPTNSEIEMIPKIEELTESVETPLKSNDIITEPDTCSLSNGLEESSLSRCEVEDGNLNSTVCGTSIEPAIASANALEEIPSNDTNSISNFLPDSTVSFGQSGSMLESMEYPSLPTLSSICLADSITSEKQKDSETNIQKELDVTSDDAPSQQIAISPRNSGSIEVNTSISKQVEDLLTIEGIPSYQTITSEATEFSAEKEDISVLKNAGLEEMNEKSSDVMLNRTLTLQDISLTVDTAAEVEQYTEFKPQRQSTTLACPNVCVNFEKLPSAAEEVTNDTFQSSLDLPEENDRFISATSEIFQDPTSFDFLLARSHSKNISRLRTESLYMKFDPLVGDFSISPERNTHPMREEQNGENKISPPTVKTPKRNPAVDTLLFFSPAPGVAVQETVETKKKIEKSTGGTKPDTANLADIKTRKELEVLRGTVLQLKNNLENRRKVYRDELEKQKLYLQDKVYDLEEQLARHVGTKSQMTVVLAEYEKSVSQLVTDRKKDRINFEQNMAILREQLQVENVHLTSTEASFNDVHQKYERLKGIIIAYKSNEVLLKESIQENMGTIKGLEARYNQLKNHTMDQLEKANFEVDAVRKQQEGETAKLRAMVRKAELKSNSLAQQVDQKVKENKELTQILDEVIARVGYGDAQ